jgi:type IV secretion system protein TrbJ
MRTLFALLLGIRLLAAPARAQWAVYDAANHADNLLQAARLLEEIENQLVQIQQFVSMLEYEARNVARLGYSAIAPFTDAIRRVTDLMSRAQGIVYDVQAIEQQFNQLFPDSIDPSRTSAQLVLDARSRWLNARTSFQHAMTVQGEIVGGIAADQQLMSALIGESQGAIGQLQATQAGNQLLGLHIKQTAALQAMLAAQGRAQATEMARQAQAQEQGREQFRRFLGDGITYSPAPVRMFHD